MDENFLNYLVDKILKDDELHKFYNDIIQSFSGEDYVSYIKKIYINQQDDLSKENIEQHKKYVLDRIRTTKKRFRSEENFNGRLINFPLLPKKKQICKKSAFDNELSKLLVYTILELFKEKEIIARPYSVQGIFNTKEKIALYPKDNQISLQGSTAYHSDTTIKREQGVLQPLFIPFENNLESIIVEKNEKVYLKSKTLDVKDQQIMDHLITEYRKIMHLEQESTLTIPITVLTRIIYSRVDSRTKTLTEKRLIKMSCQAFKVRETNSIDINDFSILQLFEVKLFTNQQGIRYAEIDLAASLKKDIKKNQFLELYKDKMSLIKDDFTVIFSEYLSRQRVKNKIQDIKTKVYPYELLYHNVNMPYARSKPKNMLKIKEALDELVSIQFIVESYKLKGNSYIEITFIDFDFFELKALKLKDKAAEYEIEDSNAIVVN